MIIGQAVINNISGDKLAETYRRWWAILDTQCPRHFCRMRDFEIRLLLAL